MNSEKDGQAISQLKAAARFVWWAVRNPATALALPFVAALGMDISDHVVHTLDVHAVRYGHTAASHQIAEGYK